VEAFSKIPVTAPRVGELISPMPGVRAWHNAGNGFVVVEVHYTADPARRGDWKYRASPKYGGLKSWRWRKEQEIEWDAKAGKLVFEQYDPDSNELNLAFDPPAHWPRWILIDPGWTNPTSMLWVAVDVDSKPNHWGFLPVHVYREFYQRRRSAKDVAWYAHELSSVTDRDGNQYLENVESIIVDPGAKQEHQSAASPEKVDDSAETVFEQLTAHIEDLGWGIPVVTGNNHKNESIVEMIVRIANYWVDHNGVPLYDSDDNYRPASEEEILEGAWQTEPTLVFHPTVPNTIREVKNYAWGEWASSEVRGRRNEQEKPVDKDDHSVTNLIRFVNEMRLLRGDVGDSEKEGLIDLEQFTSRHTVGVMKTADEIAQEHHANIAGRFRQRVTR